MIGKTNSQTGGRIKGEKLNISLKTNQSSDSDVLGAIITVSHPGGVTKYTWDGSEVTVEIPPYVEYSVECSDIDGYKTPARFASTAVADNARSISMEYMTTVITASIKSNQSSLDDLANATVTIGGKSLKNGQSAKFATGAQVAAVFSDVTGYATPAQQTITPTGINMTVSGTYETEIVSVVVSADNGIGMNGVSVTINGQSHTWNGTAISQKVAYGTSYSVSVGAKENFKSPSIQSFTASQASRSVSMTYVASLLKVSVLSNQNSDSVIAAVKATVSYGSTSVQVGNGETIAIPVDKAVTVTYPEVEGYATPSAVTVNNTNGGTATASGTYQCQLLTVNVVGDGETPVGYTVTVKNSATGAVIGSQSTDSKVYKIPFGASYEVSANKLEEFDEVASQSGTANSASKTITVTYVYNPTIDLSRVDIYGNAIAQTTANCYVVSQEGKYKFPLAYGVAIKNGQANSASYTAVSGTYNHNFVDYKGNVINSPYIETDTSVTAASVEMSISDTENAVSNIELIEGNDCRYVRFEVNDVPVTGGNAIISIKDGSGVIMWSWHIWLWSDSLNTVQITNRSNRTFHMLPYNLGSKWDDTSKTKLKNWFYQYGRPMPLLCQASYNSANNHPSYGSLTFGYSEAASGLHVGIRHPNTFYLKSSDGYCWYTKNASKTYNLWDASITKSSSISNMVKTVYDPSPVGFKIPDSDAFEYFFKVKSSDGFLWVTRHVGDTEGTPIPTIGYRASSLNGSIYTIWSALWSCSPYSGQYHYATSVESAGSNNAVRVERTEGFSVRSIKDDDLALPTHKLTINVSGDEQTPNGYTISVYQVLTSANPDTGEVTEELGELLATQTTASATHEIIWGAKYRIISSDVDEFITPAPQDGIASKEFSSVAVQYKFNPGKDLSMFDIYGNAIAQTTANCYVVSQAGKYKFPLVFGNAIKDGSVNTASFTNIGGLNSHDFVDYNGKVITSPYIESVSGSVSSVQLSIADTDGIFTNMSIVNGEGCRYVQFEVTSTNVRGVNGIISVKNSSGVIVWNWHIWVWTYDLTPVEITNSYGFKYKILPVNLATRLDGKNSINGTNGWKNWFYQFGRPTPILCPGSSIGSGVQPTYGALEFSVDNIAGNIQSGIQNPTTFYKYSSSSNYNWFSLYSAKTKNLWDAKCSSDGYDDNNVVKTVYDPCPIGFKMPNGNTFTGFGTLSGMNTVGGFDNGWRFKKDAGDTAGVFFPVSGYRSYRDGSFLQVGVEGHVWTSASYSNSNVFYMEFADGYVSAQETTVRSQALSVRPVMDIVPIEPEKITTIRIDQTITDPEGMITRIVDLGGIEAIRANSHRYTGTFADGKMTLKQLDDANGTKYVDGTDATVDMQTLGSDVWMKLPQFHWKCTEHATDVWDFEVVYGAKPDDTYKTWDGNDLIGAYEAFNASDGVYSSSARLSSGSVSQVEYKTGARARGEGFTLVKWKHHCMMAMLYYTMYGNTNCQAKIGVGVSSSNKRTGATDSLGMTDTVAGGNGDSNSINFWGLENWCGNKDEWMDNIVVDTRVWKITEDDGTVRQAGTGDSSNGWTTKLLFGENIDLIPKAVSGSETTGFCDYYYQSSSNSCVVQRSCKLASSAGGIAYVRADSDSSYTNSSLCSRLAFRGDIVIE